MPTLRRSQRPDPPSARQPTEHTRHSNPEQTERRPAKAGLPVRWAVIAILAAAGGAIGFMFAGPVAAVTTAVAVAVGAHQLLA